MTDRKEEMMKQYKFTEAQPLIDFIDRFKQETIGHTLVGYHSDLWPIGRKWITDLAIILEMDDYCIAFATFFLSELELTIGKKEEMETDADLRDMLHERGFPEDEYAETKHLVEGCKVLSVSVERFSDAFIVSECTEEVRPEGGDYFSVIRLCLDSGTTLCYCGYDEYTEYWSEDKKSGRREPSFRP